MVGVRFGFRVRVVEKNKYLNHWKGSRTVIRHRDRLRRVISSQDKFGDDLSHEVSPN